MGLTKKAPADDKLEGGGGKIGGWFKGGNFKI